MDNKKMLYIGTGLLVIGGAAIWYIKYEAKQAADAANTSSMNDAELAQLMLTQPLTSSNGLSNVGANVSTPTVDTGNSTLQSLINSVMNPTPSTVTPPSVSTSTVTDIASKAVTGPVTQTAPSRTNVVSTLIRGTNQMLSAVQS